MNGNDSDFRYVVFIRDALRGPVISSRMYVSMRNAHHVATKYRNNGFEVKVERLALAYDRGYYEDWA